MRKRFHITLAGEHRLRHGEAITRSEIWTILEIRADEQQHGKQGVIYIVVKLTQRSQQRQQRRRCSPSIGNILPVYHRYISGISPAAAAAAELISANYLHHYEREKHEISLFDNDYWIRHCFNAPLSPVASSMSALWAKLPHRRYHWISWATERPP